MIVHTDWQEPSGKNSKNITNFRYEASWVKEEQCAVIVENAWKLSMEARNKNVGDAVKWQQSYGTGAEISLEI